MNGKLSLAELFERFQLEQRFSFGYLEQITVVLNMFERWHGGTAFVRDLTAERIDAFLEFEAAKGLANETLRNRRRVLLTLWRYAWDRKLTDVRPNVARTFKRPRPVERMNG